MGSGPDVGALNPYFHPRHGQSFLLLPTPDPQLFTRRRFSRVYIGLNRNPGTMTPAPSSNTEDDDARAESWQDPAEFHDASKMETYSMRVARIRFGSGPISEPKLAHNHKCCYLIRFFARAGSLLEPV